MSKERLRRQAGGLAEAGIAPPADGRMQGGPGAKSRGAPRRADWDTWRNTPMVQLRDAVALSLDFEPDSVSMDHSEFASRLKIAVTHFHARRILRFNMQDQSAVLHSAHTQVWLPHFAAWAKAKPKPHWSLPLTLAEIAQKKLSAPARPSSGPAQRFAMQAKTWQVAVRKIARELDLEDRKAGARASLKDLAERVAVEACKRGIAGPRGELTGTNILRAALRGGLWKRAAGKAAPRAATGAAPRSAAQTQRKPVAQAAKGRAAGATKRPKRPKGPKGPTAKATGASAKTGTAAAKKTRKKT